MNRSNVQYIIWNSRNTSNTTWILRAALNDPNCIIVCKDIRYAKDLEKRYDALLYEKNNNTIFKRFVNKYFGRVINKRVTRPKFVNTDYKNFGTRLPIIFDNSALIL